MRRLSYLLVIVMLSLGASMASAQQTWQQSIEGTMCRTGKMMGNVLRIQYPRSDIPVTVDGIKLRPEMDLSTTFNFQQVRERVIVTAEIVLLAKEIPLVLDELQRDGISASALHNHLVGETPTIYYLHAGAVGDPTAIAKALLRVLKLTATPLQPAPQTLEYAVDWSSVQKIMRADGTQEAPNVISWQFPFHETVRVMGVKLLPQMDPSSDIVMQALNNGEVATTGELICTEDELDGVIRALEAEKFTISAIHNHFTGEKPRMYWVHFWAVGKIDTIATEVRAVLDNIAIKRPKQ